MHIETHTISDVSSIARLLMRSSGTMGKKHHSGFFLSVPHTMFAFSSSSTPPRMGSVGLVCADTWSLLSRAREEIPHHEVENSVLSDYTTDSLLPFCFIKERLLLSKEGKAILENLFSLSPAHFPALK